MSEDVPQYGEMNEQRARELLDRWILADGSLSTDVYGRPESDCDTSIFLRAGHDAHLDGYFTADELEAVAWWMKNRSTGNG